MFVISLASFKPINKLETVLRIWDDQSSTVRHRVYQLIVTGLHRHFSGSTSTDRHRPTLTGRHHIASAAGRVSSLHCVAAGVVTGTVIRVGIESCWHHIVSTAAGVGKQSAWFASAYIGADDCWLRQHGGWSATCVVEIATINYELFVRERFVGDTGNCGLVRLL